MKIVHLHVHSEESELDGLNKVKDLVDRAIEIGSPALGLTDHGVMSGIPDFIEACNKKGIKPIPGVEAYMVKNRLVRSEELEKMRIKMCEKYKIINHLGNPQLKKLNDFIRIVSKDIYKFEEHARELLKDYLMNESFDLFDLLSEESEMTVEEKLEEFKKDILNYLDHSGNFHLVLLAVNNQGLEDLYKIVSDAHLNGFYYDPRTDLQFIKENNLGKNIIATSACLGGYLSQLLFQNRKDEAIEFINECKEIFHSFYLEKQATLIPEQIRLNMYIDELAELTNTPKIVTTDVHFARKEEHKIHDVLVAGSMNKCIQDENRYIYAEDHYMKTAEEIKELVNDDEAILNTLKIAEQVHVTLPEKPLLPKFPVQEGDSAEEILKKKAWKKLFQYCLKNSHLDFNEYANRLNYELEVICSEGFADYFLITEDFVNATKEAGYLVGPGRGSAAGSLVCFILGITTLDPIEHELLFERFLNPERAGYPDIDIDFGIKAGKFVLNYLQEKYGKDHIAQIGTKGTLAAKAAIRFVAKAMGYSSKGNYELEDGFSKAIPNTPGIELKQAYAQEELVKKYADNYPEWWEAALKLEGHIRSFGVHAAGVVISPEPIAKVVPLRLNEDGNPTTQYDMGWIEKLLVKFDILKIDTLDLIKLTMDFANINLDIDNFPLDDPNVYNNIYKQGRLNGVFQVESDGMRDVIKNMQPDRFSDIVAVLALYRPGPMDFIPSYINRKHGIEKVIYPFEELKDVLKETYGVWVYQEQIMAASRILGGFTVGQSDMLRKAVGNKDIKLMSRWLDLMIYGSQKYIETHQHLTQQYPKEEDIPRDENGNKAVWVDYDFEDVPYIEGAINRGFDKEKLLQLKKDWISFGSYAFNKSHSASYAKISYITAWLKNYYPVEFMAALLTTAGNKKDRFNKPKSIEYTKECEEMGIKILAPNINESKKDWTPIAEEKAILYGLESIESISGETINEIIKHQPYESLADFLEKVNSKKVNKTKVINLIKSGAFDSINKNRNKLLQEYYLYREEEEEAQKIPNKTSKRHIIQYERETLGKSVSIKSRWETIEDGKKNVQFTGILRTIEPFISKKGQEHARITLETSEDIINGLIFNSKWMKLKNELILGFKITVKGEKSGDTLLINNVINTNSPESMYVELEDDK